MRKFSIIVEWDDMPIGFKSWWLRLEGVKKNEWSLKGDDVPTGLGFDVEEDDFHDNKMWQEMVMKFGNPKRKTQLKRWHILDHVKEIAYVHEE